MDSYVPESGIPVNTKDFEPTQELDVLPSDVVNTPIGVEYNGGGAPDPPKNAESKEDYATIEFADGISIDFNRRKLAAESHFFLALFLSKFKDSKSRIVKLSTINSHMFCKCFSLASSPFPPEVPLQMAVDMLPIASFLSMDALLDLLSDIIHYNVDTSSILPILRMASHRYPPLADRLWNTVIGRFSALVVNGDHLQLTEDEFLESFKNEKLNIPSTMEETVAYPEDDRIAKICENLSFVGDGVNTCGVYRNRIPSEAVLSLGGWCSTGATDVIETYNSRNSKWIANTSFRSDVPRAYHAFNILNDNNLLVCGGMNGREHFSKTSIFDMRTKEWTQLSDMHERRCYITGSVVPNSAQKKLIMVVGGFNGMERLNTCEMFNLDENIWQTMPNLTKCRSDYGSVAIGSHLAAIGGFDGRQVHFDVEIYNPETNQWYPFASRMHSRRTGVSAVALDSNVILAVGGFDGTRRLRTMEMLDLREGKWHWLPEMKTPRSNFGAEYMDGCLYALGGYNGVSTTPTTEKFDMAAQKWEHLSAMHVSKSALKVARLTDPDIIRQLIQFDHPEAGC